MTTIRTYWDDDVDGIIIGDVTFPYQFWVEEKRPEYQNKTGIPWRKVAEGFFKNDKEAAKWFQENYPEEYRRGAEMRCFDETGPRRESEY